MPLSGCAVCRWMREVALVAPSHWCWCGPGRDMPLAHPDARIPAKVYLADDLLQECCGSLVMLKIPPLLFKKIFVADVILNAIVAR